MEQGTHDSSWLENLLDLAVNSLPARGVNGSLNRVDSVEGVLAELLYELHEVALDEGDLVLQPSGLRVLLCAADLVLVVVDTDDLDVREAGNLTRRSTDTATDVKDAHTWLQLHVGSQVVFMAGERRDEAFTLVETREVEGSRPSVLVENSSAVVVSYVAKT